MRLRHVKITGASEMRRRQALMVHQGIVRVQGSKADCKLAVWRFLLGGTELSRWISVSP